MGNFIRNIIDHTPKIECKVIVCDHPATHYEHLPETCYEYECNHGAMCLCCVVLHIRLYQQYVVRANKN